MMIFATTLVRLLGALGIAASVTPLVAAAPADPANFSRYDGVVGPLVARMRYTRRLAR